MCVCVRKGGLKKACDYRLSLVGVGGGGVRREGGGCGGNDCFDG